MDLDAAVYDLVVGTLSEMAGCATGTPVEVALDVQDPATGRYSCVRATPDLARRLPRAYPATTALTGRNPVDIRAAAVLPWRRGPRRGVVAALPMGKSGVGPAGVALLPFSDGMTDVLPLALARTAIRLGPVLESTAMSAHVYNLAVRDAMTRLYNRGFADGFLSVAVARALRNRERLAFVILDLDHFKAVNDTYGHQAGDRVLTEFAAVLGMCARASDVAARWGGEEFALILPGTDGRGAATVAANVMERMRGRILPAPGAPAVTCSAGAASIPDDARDAAGLVAEADRALYAAKEGGRDRIVLAH